MSEHEAEGEEEEQAPEPQEWESFIIHPDHVEAFWVSPRPKEAMIEHYQKTFNPENKLDEEKLDYNELNIVAEFQVYNLIFAKKDLLLENEKATYLMEIFWRLLGIADNGDREEGHPKAADDLNIALDSKFNAFKTNVIKRARDGIFSKEEVKKIVDYARRGYFRHFRLFDYTLNNKQLFDVKKVTIFQETPTFVPCLDEAMGLNDMKEDEVMQEEAPEGEGPAEGEGEAEGDQEKPAGEGEES